MLFAFLVLTLGCERKKASFVPLENGFGVVVQAIGIDTGPGAELYYKGTNESPVLVWPYIGTSGYPILYTNDIALLLADKPDDQGRLGHGALIAVRGTGPAMDISKDVLQIAAKQAQVDFRKALRVCRPLRLNETGGKLKVLYLANELAEPNIPDLGVQVTWEQIFEIMREVKSSGKTNRFVNSEVLYLQKDYSSINETK